MDQQEETSQAEVALNPFPSTKNDLPSSPKQQNLRVDTIAIVATVSAAFLAALIGLLSASGPGGWRYYLAGGMCAAISHAIATPIDVVKVRRMLFQQL